MPTAAVEFRGAEALVAKLRSRAAKYVGQDGYSRPVVEVGYTAAYALWVHENMEIWPPGMRLKGLPRGGGFYRDAQGIVRYPIRAETTGVVGFKAHGFYWDPQGTARPKFLEQPAREKRDEIARMILDGMKNGMTMAQALLRAGLYLQRESQMLVPVDTGNLKASAFTRLSEEAAPLAVSTSVEGAGPIYTHASRDGS